MKKEIRMQALILVALSLPGLAAGQEWDSLRGHHAFSVLCAMLPERAEITAVHRDDLLGGVTVLRGPALADGQRPAEFTAVPY